MCFKTARGLEARIVCVRLFLGLCVFVCNIPSRLISPQQCTKPTWGLLSPRGLCEISTPALSRGFEISQVSALAACSMNRDQEMDLDKSGAKAWLRVHTGFGGFILINI